MTARLLQGRPLAQSLRVETTRRGEAFARANGRRPRLGLLAVGTEAEAEAHVRREEAACREAGIDCELRLLPARSAQRDCESALAALSDAPDVDGVLVELPLPGTLSAAPLFERLDPAKDVDGQTPIQMGRLYGSKTLADARRAVWPCTAEAIVSLVESAGISLSGKEALVAGRSSVVGRPAAHLLGCLDATVTLCHSRTRGLEELARRADVVVCATRSPGWLKEVKPGAVVVDAGTHAVGGRLVGDAAASVAAQASFLTPVPGGVGPVTIELLLRHVVEAAERRTR